MLERWPRVVALRSLCIRVVHRHRVPTAAVPPLLLVYPDEIEEQQLAVETERMYAEGRERKRKREEGGEGGRFVRQR